MKNSNKIKRINYRNRLPMANNGMPVWGTGGMAGTVGSLGSGVINEIDAADGKQSLGMSVASGALAGAGAGAMFGPWGAAIGGVVGGGTALTKGLIDKKKLEDAQEKQLMDYTLSQGPTSYAKYGGNLSNMYNPVMAMGVQPQYEAENNEVVLGNRPKVFNGGEVNKLANGVYKTKGRTHEQGGMEMNGGDYVYSDT